jgi:tRNA-binding protein
MPPPRDDHGARDPITYADFVKVHMAVGRVTEVQEFERARTPSYRVRIDFGSGIGERWSSLQAKAWYSHEDMLGRLVVAVVNLPPKNIAGFVSEVLVLGVPAEDDSLSLLLPDRGASLGADVY